MAAMPMLTPRAESRALSRRERSPRLPTRKRSGKVSLLFTAYPPLRPSSNGRRDHPRSRRIANDQPVAKLDVVRYRARDLVVVGDDHDGPALVIEVAEQLHD